MSYFDGPVYAERKGYEQNFFDNLSEALETIIDGYHPHYEHAKVIEIFECDIKQVQPCVTAESIIEDIDNNISWGELPEEECWSDNLCEEGKKELADFLEKWLPQMKRDVWKPSDRKIDIDWDKQIAFYLGAHPAQHEVR